MTSQIQRKVSYFFSSLLIILLGVQIVTAQTSSITINEGSDHWILPNLVCEGALCNTRITPAGNITIVDTTANQLYVSIRNEDHYTQYDLQAMSTFMNGFVDFIPLDASSKIVFASDTGSAVLGEYDTTTRSFTQLNLSEYGRIKSCNNYLATAIAPQGYILPIGIGSQFLFCSFDENSELTVHIYDVSSNQVQNLDFGAKGIGDNSQGKPWNSLVGGQDGNLYIEVFDPPKYLETLVSSSITSISLTHRSRALVKYTVASGTWSFQTITADQMLSSTFSDSRFIRAARTISVDANGNSYFYFEPSDSPPATVMNLTIINPNSSALFRLTSSDFTQSKVFVGVTQDGLVLLAGSQGLSSLSLEQIDNYPLENNSTNTPLVPTNTPTNTPTVNTFPSTGVLDNFNRANGTIGSNWAGTVLPT